MSDETKIALAFLLMGLAITGIFIHELMSR